MNFSQLDFGLFSLRIYGILFALAFIVSSWTYYRNLQKNAFPIDFFVHHFWHWVLVGVFIGRLFALMLHPQFFWDAPFLSFFAFWNGGISVYGFMFGFIAFMWRETHDHQFGFWRWIEHLIQPLFFLLLCHDLVSFTTGHLYGLETSLPWGVQYETFGVETIKPVHPIGAYAFIVHFCLWVWWFYGLKKSQLATKQALKIILLSLLVTDFLLQFLTANVKATVLGVLKIEQILVFILGLFLVRNIWRTDKMKG